MRATGKWILLAMLGLAVAVVVLVCAAAFSKGSSNHAAFRRVKVGMTKAEVEQILTDQGTVACDFGLGWTEVFLPQRRLWTDEEWLEVFFTADTFRASGVHIHHLSHDKRTVWQRVEDEYRYQSHKMRR
jgi:hypothetical protein